MAQLGGYIFLFKDAFVQTLQDQFRSKEIKETFNFILSNKYKTIEFHFISIDNKNINYITLVKQGQKQYGDVFDKSKLIFFDYFEIKSPISIVELEKKINQELKCFSINENEAKKYDCYIEKNWNKLINEVKKIRPKLRSKIDDMLNKVVSHSFSGHKFNLMAQQKDAIQLTLDFSFPPQAKVKNFKYELPETETQADNFFNFIEPNEDSLIFFDLLKFSNWTEKTDKQTPISRTFQYANKVVTITNVNRNQYEKALGVDLLYYNHEYNSFIMIQYKLWENKSQDNLFFRADSQYDKAIQRMANFEKLLSEKIKTETTEIQPQKLNINPFYFKICNPTQLNYNNEMISGIYIDYKYLEAIMKLRLGERDGKIIREKDIINPVNNALFIELVKKGLIGSTKVDSHKLDKFVEDLLDADRNVILGESFNLTKNQNNRHKQLRLI